MSALDEQLALLPSRLGPHLWLVLISLGVGVALSLPLALVAVRVAALRWAVLTTAGVVQTIPGLALLALMVPLLDGARRALGADFPAFGFLPAALALVLYSMLPVLRNAVTGLRGVDAAVLEAAVGVGLSPRQVLLQVQLPLAAPFILAGIRTSAVWTVGTATLSTPVGQTSLGNYIFSGLQTRNWTAVLVGCVVTARARAGARRGAGPAGGGGHAAASRPAGARAGLVGGAAGAGHRPAPRGLCRRGGRVVRIGAKNFTEQYILAQVLSLSLRAQGFETATVEGLGSTILFDALAQGDVDVAVDYSGTLWANQLHRSDVAAPEVVLGEVGTWLDAHHGIGSLGSLGFENTYTLALPGDRAAALGLGSLDQLAAPIRAMRLGSDYEFFSRPEWKRVAETYDLHPKELVSSDPSLMYAAVKAGTFASLRGKAKKTCYRAQGLGFRHAPVARARALVKPHHPPPLAAGKNRHSGNCVNRLRFQQLAFRCGEILDLTCYQPASAEEVEPAAVTRLGHRNTLQLRVANLRGDARRNPFEALAEQQSLIPIIMCFKDVDAADARRFAEIRQQEITACVPVLVSQVTRGSCTDCNKYCVATAGCQIPLAFTAHIMQGNYRQFAAGGAPHARLQGTRTYARIGAFQHWIQIKGTGRAKAFKENRPVCNPRVNVAGVSMENTFARPDQILRGLPVGSQNATDLVKAIDRMLTELKHRAQLDQPGIIYAVFIIILLLRQNPPLAKSSATDNNSARHRFRKKPPALARRGLALQREVLASYIMPSMPPGIAGISSLSLGSSAIIASVVSSKPATDAAFCNAERVTLVGSRMPMLNMSPYSPLAAL